jgi:EAL and modified HD-GYP domain-containing signal transduction protein
MPRHGERCFIGRQPILDRNGRLFAYELLFRKGVRNEAVVDNPSRATASVIIDTVSSFGINDMLGGRKGFVNVDFDMLMSDAVELLPRSQTVIELLETIEPTAEVVDRCRDLKEQGFSLALDDHEYHPRFEELYGIVDLVKVDLIVTPLEQLPAMLQQFKPYPFKLLAEKVETRSAFDACRDLGFDFFQGYYFAKPSIMQKKRMNENMATLLKLLRLLADDTDLEEVELTFKGSPSLTYKLLLLVNSVAFGARERIQSVRHALSMAGIQQIKRWVQLVLFAADNEDSIENPLVDMAAVRAGFMEQLARVHPVLRRDREAPERAYMTGILSLMERIFDLSIQEIIVNLNLTEELIEALLERKGVYGRLLRAVERIEALEFPAAAEELAAMGIPMNEILDLQVRAFNWRKGLE